MVLFFLSLSEFVVIHNGIITNYKELKAYLVSPQIPFSKLHSSLIFFFRPRPVVLVLLKTGNHTLKRFRYLIYCLKALRSFCGFKKSSELVTLNATSDPDTQIYFPWANKKTNTISVCRNVLKVLMCGDCSDVSFVIRFLCASV